MESHFIPSYRRRFGDPSDDREARALARRILQLRWIRRWRLKGVTPEEFSECRSYVQVVCRLFDFWARQEGKPRWGDKTPQYVAEIPALIELFPNARIIHIYRDGRDVALSWLPTEFEPRNLFTAARMWAAYVRKGMRDGRELPAENYHEVKYEMLLDQPRGMMEEICEFIQAPFTEAVLRLAPHEGSRGRGEPGRKRYAGTGTVIRPGNKEKWRLALNARQRVLFESEAGDLLEQLGYEIGPKQRTISMPERLYWNTHHWTLWAKTRLVDQRRRDLLLTALRMRLGWLVG